MSTRFSFVLHFIQKQVLKCQFFHLTDFYMKCNKENKQKKAISVLEYSENNGEYIE